MDQSTPKDSSVSEESPRRREPPRSLLSNNWRVRDPAPQPSDADNSNSGSRDGQRSGNDTRKTAFGRKNDWRNRQEEPATPTNASPKRAAPGRPIEDSKALAEGRRIYIGNLFYHIRPEQVTESLKAEGFGAIEKIHISIDPVTGRNPGYCFVEFESRDVAEAAIRDMAGVLIEGRPLKTGTCQPKQQQKQQQQQTPWAQQGSWRPPRDFKPTFERWGNWTSDRGEVLENGQGPIGAEGHLRGVVETDQRCRVYVGGLDRTASQEENDKELRVIFKGFDVVAFGKRVTPHQSTWSQPGKHHFAFVDLASEETAQAAIKALNGTTWQGSRLKVRIATSMPTKIRQRGIPYNELGRPVGEPADEP